MDVLMGLVLKTSSRHRSLKLLPRNSRLRIGEPHLTCGKNEIERSLGLGRNRGKEIIYGVDRLPFMAILSGRAEKRDGFLAVEVTTGSSGKNCGC